MADSQVFNGSICLTDLITYAKNGHSAFSKGKNGKIYVNYTEWVNETPNQYGQHTSILLNSHKDKKAEEGKVYIGNGKKGEFTAEPVSSSDMDGLNLDGANIASGPQSLGPVDSLPF
jgi:hypothetical protein